MITQKTINPKLNFVSVESKEAVTGLIKRMTEVNKRLSDQMKIKAPLLQTYKGIMDEEIAIDNIIPEINKAIDSSLEDWADVTFATLDQYQSLLEEVMSLRNEIQKVKDEITAEYLYGEYKM